MIMYNTALHWIRGNFLITRAWWVWRVLATGLCFSLFGLGGLLLSISWLPILRLSIMDQDRRKQAARNMVQFTFRFFVGVMKAVGVLDVHIDNPEKVEQMAGKIVIANHPSLIDVVIMISLIKHSTCIVKGKLSQNPFMWRVIKNAGYILNTGSPEQLISDCEQALNRGDNLIIFPEGTRTTRNQAIKFQRGAANLAVRTAKEIQPCVIAVSPSTLTKQDRWYHVPVESKVYFKMKILDIIPTQQMIAGLTQSIAARRLNQAMETMYTKGEVIKWNN